MAYKLRSNEAVEYSVRRIACEEIDEARRHLTDETVDRPEAIHEFRKHCKKIRGLVRLVRPDFGAYKEENAWFRDASRELSDVRDAEAVIEALDGLEKSFGREVGYGLFADVRHGVLDRKKRMVAEAGELEEQMKVLAERLRDARGGAASWCFSAAGFDLLERGLRKTYRRGGKAMKAAYENPTTERFHEWRKRAKYFRYHCYILSPLWEETIKSYWKEVKKLSDYLGDDHDCAVLRGILAENPRWYGGERAVQSIIGLADQRSAELRVNAKILGERVYAESPKALVRRMRRYYDAWQCHPAAETPIEKSHQ